MRRGGCWGFDVAKSGWLSPRRWRLRERLLCVAIRGTRGEWRWAGTARRWIAAGVGVQGMGGDMAGEGNERGGGEGSLSPGALTWQRWRAGYGRRPVTWQVRG